MMHGWLASTTVAAAAGGGFTLGDLHPVIVHAPVAFLVVAPLFDLLGWIRGLRWADHCGLALQILGGAAAWLASFLFHPHPDQPFLRARGAWEAFDAHETWAYVTAGLALVLIAFRLLVLPMEPRRWSRAVIVIVGILTAVAVGVAGYYGGELTFTHGIGVDPPVAR